MLSIRNSLAYIGKYQPIRVPSDLPMPSKHLRQALVTWRGKGNPHQNYPYYYKGQVHVHSDVKDGSYPAKRVESMYQEKGYTFICLTDHNTATPDPGAEGILHITSAEDGWGFPHHLLILGIKDAEHGIPPISTNPPGNIQPRIDFINGMGEMCIPNIHDYKLGGATWEKDELIENSGYVGLEIYNATGGDNRWSGHNWWDDILSNKRIWGFATDDFETEEHLTEGKFNCGWIVVNSSLGPPQEYIDRREDELRRDLLQNIRCGNFYAVVREPAGQTLPGVHDLGPRLKIQYLKNDVFHVETDQNCISIKFIGKGSCLLRQFSNVSSADYRITGLEYYLRVELRQIRHGQIHRVFTQPVFI